MPSCRAFRLVSIHVLCCVVLCVCAFSLHFVLSPSSLICRNALAECAYVSLSDLLTPLSYISSHIPPSQLSRFSHPSSPPLPVSPPSLSQLSSAEPDFFCLVLPYCIRTPSSEVSARWSLFPMSRHDSTCSRGE